MKIEVCINQLADVSRVQDLSIDRIELCIELGCGGITPSLAMIEKAVAISHVPIHVLVRLRSGDFMYSALDYEMMMATCQAIQDLGAAGIVTGGLTPERTLPLPILKKYRKALPSCALYFHRAFDELLQPEIGISQLQELGFDGVLTSGQAPTAEEGFDTLVQWQTRCPSPFVLLPGSGIGPDNCLRFKDAGFEWVHLSAKQRIHTTKHSMFAAPQYQVDRELLKKVVTLLKKNPQS